jgi:hypothetical protein
MKNRQELTRIVKLLKGGCVKTKTIARLRKEADKLYQIKLIKLKPKSAVSGEPTEVIHHYVSKSQSNNLRYDTDNGVPLTHKEHARHHLSGDPNIVASILKTYGQEWHDDLQRYRYIIFKFNKGNLLEIIKELEEL